MATPQILPVRRQAEVIHRILRKRLDTILPEAMRADELDMWIILCQEDDYDPVFRTMVPLNTWAPILQMLIFVDRGSAGIERINLSMTDTADLYDRPWKGNRHEEQWKLLAGIIEERKPQRIGINTGAINWASGGLTHNLYQQLLQTLPSGYTNRLVPAESACTHWLMQLTDDELEIFVHVAKIAHWIIQECFSSKYITPGVTTTEDLEWAYWQISLDLGLELSFKPFFRLIRSDGMKAGYPVEDKVIRRGDLLHCDVGIRYLRLNSDNQELAYVLKSGESHPPSGLESLLREGNRLQTIFMDEFKAGLTGNELLTRILTRARNEGIPNPRIYSHSLGLFLHQPGPLIGLPWEQTSNPGRGDVRLVSHSCFTMELAVEDAVAEWGDQMVRLSLEQDVKYTEEEGCVPLDGVQTDFHLI